nr:receptor kinase-like protein Xa21 isoform X1 [Ipomoea batatas]
MLGWARSLNDGGYGAYRYLLWIIWALLWPSSGNSSNFQTVATNNAGPSRIISSAKPSSKASTNQPNPKSYTTPIVGIGNGSKCGELSHYCSNNECTTQMSANLIKEYVEGDEKGDGYDEEDIKVVEDVGDPVNSCMQRHLLYEEEKSPNQHNISRANGSMFRKVCNLTIDDGNCYNINSKFLDRHLDLEIETQPRLYIMEVDKSYEGIVRWVVIGPMYPKQPRSAHEFYWHQLDSRNLNGEAENVIILGEIKANVKSANSKRAIPKELCVSSSLSYLFLYSNILSGAIPKEIGNLTAIELLSIEFNNFGGEIPQEIGKLYTLKWVGLGSANLSGTIPKEIFNISSLIFIELSDNNLVGTLPTSMGYALPDLEVVYLGINFISGAIPESISNCSKLAILSLEGNRFSGTLPTFLGNLRLLEELHLQDCSSTCRRPETGDKVVGKESSSSRLLSSEFCTFADGQRLRQWRRRLVFNS